jgi:hypothetical protein
MERQASEEFWDAVISGGGLNADCDLCGRVHFVDHGVNYEEGELEGLFESQKQEPEKYISHDIEDVHFGSLGGKSLVYECDCGRAVEYEQFIWNSRSVIANYLRKKTRLILVDAERDVRLSENLDKVIEEEP